MESADKEKIIIAAVLIASVLAGILAIYIGLSVLNDDIHAFRGTFITAFSALSAFPGSF
jgi:hypothetical protein